MREIWRLLLISACIFMVSSQVTRIALIDIHSYAVSIIQKTMWRVERKCWCNLKIDDTHVSLNESVLGDALTAEIDLKNGFVVSVERMNIVQNTIQRGWAPTALNTTMVNIFSTMRLVNVAMGFDVSITVGGKKLHTTGLMVYPLLEFRFTITKHLMTDEITADVVGAPVRHTNVMTFFPENDVTKVFTVLFDWNCTAPSVARWASDIIKPITLELATKEIEFPRICFDCAT